MSTHAMLSPSKRSRWALCPGSIREEAKYPDERSGAAAIDGTHTHTLLEHCIKAGLGDPTSMVGVKMKDEDGEFVIDEARAQRAKVAIDYVKQRVAEFNGMAEVIPETRVDPQWFTHRDDLSGTVDIQIIGNGVLEIVDYKDGMGIVEAENNLQLEQYAMGKLAECKLGWNVPEQYPWKEVHMTIIQPKLALKGMEPITKWIVPVKYLLDRLSVLSAQARATDDPNAPLVPGESQCKFCRAKGSCAALASNVMKEVGIMFQPVVTQTLDVAQQSADKDPATMDDQQIRQIMEAAPLMRQLLEAVEKEALRRLEAGQSLPGLKLVHGRGSRAWALTEDEMAEKLIEVGVPEGKIYERKLITPAKAEKIIRRWWNRPIDQVVESLVRAKIPKRQITQELLDDPDMLPIFKWTNRAGEGCALSQRQVAMLMSELTYSTEECLAKMDQEYVTKLAGKLTVVPESDSRPAVILNAAPMFSAVVAPLKEDGTDQTAVLQAAIDQASLPSWLS